MRSIDKIDLYGSRQSNIRFSGGIHSLHRATAINLTEATAHPPFGVSVEGIPPIPRAGVYAYSRDHHPRRTRFQQAQECIDGYCAGLRVLRMDDAGNSRFLISKEIIIQWPIRNGGDVFNVLLNYFARNNIILSDGARQQCQDAFFQANATIINRSVSTETGNYEFQNPAHKDTNVLNGQWFSLPAVCVQSQLGSQGNVVQTTPPIQVFEATQSISPTSAPLARVEARVARVAQRPSSEPPKPLSTGEYIVGLCSPLLLIPVAVVMILVRDVIAKRRRSNRYHSGYSSQTYSAIPHTQPSHRARGVPDEDAEGFLTGEWDDCEARSLVAVPWPGSSGEPEQTILVPRQLLAPHVSRPSMEYIFTDLMTNRPVAVTVSKDGGWEFDAVLTPEELRQAAELVDLLHVALPKDEFRHLVHVEGLQRQDFVDHPPIEMPLSQVGVSYGPLGTPTVPTRPDFAATLLSTELGLEGEERDEGADDAGELEKTEPDEVGETFHDLPERDVNDDLRAPGKSIGIGYCDTEGTGLQYGTFQGDDL